MKLKNLSLACAAALLSGQVFAHPPGTATTIPPIYISGASAQDKALAALVSDLCVAGTLDTFKDGVPASGKGYTSYFCTIDSTKVDGMDTDQVVLISKRSAGGSGKGVQVVADAVAIEAMNINNGNCSDANADHVWDCDISGGVGSGDLIMQVSTAGISDVEPAMFTGPNVPPGDSAVTPSQIGKLDISTMNAVVFGVPVTENLYRALQIAQGLDSTSVDKDNEANMPSLTSAQVNGIITGNIKKWSDLVIGTIPLTSYPGVTPPTFDFFPPNNNNPLVHICRRVPGSGTQSQMNAVFANSPCAAGVQQTALAPGNPATGPLVTEGEGSGNVDSCMVAANTANKWAVGVQSLEKVNAAYRFVKIDGVAPTVQNVAENKYKDWVETSIQWRNVANGGPAVGSDTLDLLNTIAKNASTPGTIATLNTAFIHGFGTGAYLALNTNGHVPSYPHDDANPVTTATHAPLGIPNTCNPPVVNVKSEL
jgi:hypothetical protein